MSRASEVGRNAVRKYFAQRGTESPGDQANSLLRRITIRDDNRWRSADLTSTAEGILASSAFDVDDFAENFLGVGLSIETLDGYDADAGSQVFGLAYPPEREIVICERAERYLPLYRATVAHELGHVVLHGGGVRPRQLAYAPTAPRRPKEELEADEFMVATLAPDSVIMLAVMLAAQDAGISPWEARWKANSARGHWQWRHLILQPLVDRLCLSRHMLLVRLHRLGVLDAGSVEYHKTYRLPTRWRRDDVALSPTFRMNFERFL